jgi:hypothetical protein
MLPLFTARKSVGGKKNSVQADKTREKGGKKKENQHVI